MNNEKDYWPMELPHKNTENLRIGFININGIPKDNSHSKLQRIQNTIARNELDVIGMVETNINWSKLNHQQQWRDKTAGWWESSASITSHNITETSPRAFQPGGTILQCIDKAAHRCSSRGRDTTGLGRWTWMRFTGANNINLRIVNAYRTCKPTSAGPTTAYSQQQRYFTERDDERDPRDAILEDIGKEIIKWTEEGDQIILYMDFNEDVRDNKIQKWAEDIGLSDAINTAENKADSPPTYHRGSKPIDGIFVSHTINIISSGLMPFGEFPSDHRGAWLELTMANAFGYKMKNTAPHKARRLKSDDPFVRKRWIKVYKEEINKMQLPQRLYRIQEQLTYPIHPDDANEYEKIMKLRQQARDKADQNCRKLRMGGVAYSDKYKQASERIELWRGLLKRHNGGKFSSSKLKALGRKLNICNVLQIPKEEAEEQVIQAHKNYWEVKKKATEYRIDYLRSKAQDIAKDTGGNEENIYDQLRRHEEQRNASKRIKQTLHKIHGGGVTRISIKNQQGQWQEVTTKQGIESECIKENEKKYRQTESTPLMQPYLTNLLNYDGQTQAGEDILNGTFNYPIETPKYTRELLNEFKRATNLILAPDPAIVTTEYFKDGWKKMKEATSAGKSSLHFGHLKTCAMDEELAAFEATIAHVPYCTGYVPSDWKEGIACMIHKKANSDRIDKLRTIILMEADFNWNNKKMGRDTIAHAERNNLIAPEQYGSRKGRKAIDQALNKRLIYDLMRQSRKPGALCSNDAKSCYDRILHSIITLAFKRLGVPEQPLECMINCIQQMKFYIRTLYGESDEFFSSGGKAIPFQGVLQGNGASPTIWVVVSTPLLNMLRTAQNGAHLKAPISMDTSHFVGYAFVDDTDLITFNMNEIDSESEKIMDNMQEAIDRWEGGLKATGGAIVPEKSWIFPIDFDFDANGKWSYKSVDEIDREFTVLDHTETRKTLEQLEASDSKETLGVYLAPDGNNKVAVHHLRKKAEKWRSYIKTGFLQSKDVRLASDYIMRGIEYGMPALTLSEQECDYIMAPIMEAALTRTHTCRTIPKAVRYGPIEEKGLGFQNLYVRKGLMQISSLVQFVNSDTITGQELRTSIEMAKVEIGTGRDLFQLQYDEFHPLLTDCWIKDVWRFCHEKNIQIQESVTPNLHLQRERDSFIMEDIVTECNFSPEELRHINRMRLYLQVTTIADIVTGDGKHLQYNIYKGEKNKDTITPYHWPRQEKPGQRAIDLWRKALRQICPREDQKLIYPLGSWFDTNRSVWPWFYHEESKILYKREKRFWHQYKRATRGGKMGKRPKFHYFQQSVHLPPTAKRATVQRYERYVVLTGHANELISVNLQPTDDDHHNWQLMHQSHFEETYNNWTKTEFLEALANNEVCAVSDGSYYAEEQFSTAACIIADKRNKSKHIILSWMTPGEPGIQCSHRGELAGILLGTMYISKICQVHHLNNTHITYKCDGEGAISVCSNLHFTIRTGRKHFDLITAINECLKESTVKWTFEHVKGHQDQTTATQNLDYWALLNMIADEEAKQKAARLMQSNTHLATRPELLPYEKCRVFWKPPGKPRTKIGNHLLNTLEKNITTIEIRNYWKKKNVFHYTHTNRIDWAASNKCGSISDNNRCKFISKWLSGFCGVGTMLLLWKHQSHSNCPRCNQPHETTHHVLQCRHTEAQSLWNQEIEKLSAWMIERQAEPYLREAIITGMNNWRNERNNFAPAHYSYNLRMAITEQNYISWKSFIGGFWSSQWQQVQKQHLQSIGSQASPTLWIARLQRRIWEVAWTLWEHRNIYLHEKQESIVGNELQAINEEIRQEWNTGISNLPARYSNLFRGTIEHRLDDSGNGKIKWLASVWAARDMDSRNTGHPTRTRNPQALAYFERWRKRNKRKRLTGGALTATDETLEHNVRRQRRRITNGRKRHRPTGDDTTDNNERHQRRRITYGRKRNRPTGDSHTEMDTTSETQGGRQRRRMH